MGACDFVYLEALDLSIFMFRISTPKENAMAK